MLTQDLEAYLEACSEVTAGGYGPDQKLNVWANATAHELGHQRAGLTHTDYYPDFHDPSFYANDIMLSSLSIMQMAGSRTAYQFCRPSAVVREEGDFESCRGNLLRNRVVYPQAPGRQGEDRMHGGHP